MKSIFKIKKNNFGIFYKFNLLIFTFANLLIIIPFSVYSQSWSQITDFPSNERDDACVFVIGNKAYCGTGFLPWFAPSNDFYCFNMSNDTWSTINSMPALTERQYACGFSHNQYGYVFGGSSGSNFLNDLYRYDTLTGNWTQMASLPDTGRAGSSCFLIGDTAYIIGGKNSTINATNEVWAYAILTDSWIQQSYLPNNGRWRANAISVNGKGYLLFGRDKNGKFCSELYEYTVMTDSWNLISSFPLQGRNYSSLTTINNDLYIVAGIDTSNTYYNDLWTYDVLSNGWTNLSSIPSFGRKGGLSFSSSNTIYYTTGINSSNVRQKETWKIYNPNSIKELGEELNLSIFPNPSTGIVNVETDLAYFNVKISAIDGQTVYSSTNFSNKCVIDASHLASGLYYLYISNGIQITSKKIIIN